MTSIENYIESLRDLNQKKAIGSLYKIIKNKLPEATECISYGMPCFKWKDKPIVYFAANKKHIGFYPTAAAIQEHKKLLTDFTYSKGSVHFSYELPLPENLIYIFIESRLKIFSK